MTEETVTRFWANVEKTPACWLWAGTPTGNGYGQFRVGGGQRIGPHRFAYGLMVGPVPEGMHLDHLCRNRLCVNPAHLEPVTSTENMRRGRALSPKTQRRAECHKGHSLFVPRNLYVTPDGRRQCRECHREREALRRLRKRTG